MSITTPPSPCPKCGVPVRKLGRHLRKVHPERPKPISTSRPAVQKRSGREGRLSKEGWVRPHVRVEHLRIMVACPVCREPIVEAKLASHLPYCEGAESRRQRWIEAQRTRTLSPDVPSQQLGIKARRVRSGSTQDKSQAEQNHSMTRNSVLDSAHDATRDYFMNYRERGKFGSHPSHDGYDDEDRP
jgi:endogenous inhibitor of DNA gyrase (YacG/DUF329 family)